MITLEELRRIIPYAGPRAALFHPPLLDAMREFGIDTPARVAAFIAQLAHESGSFRYVREIASGEAYDTGELARRLGNTPEDDGDGERYKGRGLIQITGRANYIACGAALGLDLIAHPELLEEPENACRSAAWYWDWKGLNDLADRGDFKLITKKINGGYNGYQDRLAFWERAKEVIGA
jgi:putative chitinase